MSVESEWVRSLCPLFEETLAEQSVAGARVSVAAGVGLPYAHEITGYSQEGRHIPRLATYETDLLISDALDDGSWVPRVVIEFKLGRVTTHDALTYSAKAATHKQVHPYLRYGIIIGDSNYNRLQPRLVRHGAFFDFMTFWRSDAPSEDEWRTCRDILVQELDASRSLQILLSDNSAEKPYYSSLHRPLVLK